MNRPALADVTPSTLSARCAAKTSAPNEHHAFVVRLFIGSVGLIVLGLAVAVATNLSWSMPVDQLWMMALLTVVLSLQLRFRIDAGNPTRRTSEALWEAPMVMALFWMEPWPVIASALAGFAAAWPALPEMKWRWRAFNAGSQFLVYVAVTRVATWIAPANALDVPRSVWLAACVWAVADLVRLVPFAAMSWARWRAVRLELVPSTFAPTKTRATAAGVGLVIAAAFEESPWMLVPLVPLVILLYRSGANANRVASLQIGLGQLSEMSAATAVGTELEAIERALIDAVSTVGGADGTAVARPADADDPDGAVVFNGILEPTIRAALSTMSELRARSDTKPAPAAPGLDVVGVWLVDPVRSCYLVVMTHRSKRLKDLWVIVGHLASSARLAMANAHQQVALVDIAEREYWRARTDESTGLPNQYAARVELDRRIEAGNTAPFGVVAVSLYGYKQLVDVLGKERGDEAIAAFAHRLKSVPGVEYLARVGLSEFVLVASGTVTELVDLADRARQVEAGPDDKTLVLRDASAGVAIAYPNQPISGSDLLGRAALALDRAERSGDVVAFGDAELADEERRIAIRLGLGDAIAKREVWPAFQPQIDLVTGAVAGLEVLARWTSPELGFVSPAEFIEVAEQSNQIERLTVSILEQALETYRVWARDGATFPISVNLSATSLTRPTFLALLVDIVKQSGLPASMLTFEITESTLVENADTLDALARLADLGALISIDDFGTGYSSLSYLERLPIHELKIDRSMVMPIDEGSTISPVLRWLTRMSQDLGYVVVAEGIETPAQLRALQELSVDAGQGYLFAHPMPGDEMTIWLRDYAPSELFVNRRRLNP